MRQSYVTGTVDTRSLDKLLKKLELEGKEGKKVIKQSCRVALEVINEETVEQALELNLRPSGKGWRKALKLKSAFIYKDRKIRKGSFWFYSAINYKKPILRISHLVEKGFQHIKAGFVPGNWYRRSAFRAKRVQALRELEKALMHGMGFIAKGEKVPGLVQYRKGVRK